MNIVTVPLRYIGGMVPDVFQVTLHPSRSQQKSTKQLMILIKILVY